MTLKRSLTLHKENNPRQFCEVLAHGEPNRGGANIRYTVEVPNDLSGPVTKAVCTIAFQDGHPDEVGYNGGLDSAVLAVLIDRQRGFQSGPWPSSYGEEALEYLEKALAAMDARVQDRIQRDVMNTDAK